MFIRFIAKFLKDILAVGLQMIIGQKTTCQETKCSFLEDEHHEFLIKWN